MANEGVSQDVVFRLLSHVYRRALLEYLDRRDGPVSLADAAREVALRCSEKPVTELSDEEIREVYLALHHSHVPRLADEETVAYDRDRKLVSLTDRGDRVVDVHERLTTTDSVELTDHSG